MVHLYIFNPIQRVGLLARMWFRKSKPSLDSDVSAWTPTQENSPSLSVYAAQPARTQPKTYRHLAPLAWPLKEPSKARPDPVYYNSESEARLCTFLVESTLFRVQRCYLVREPSVFADMFNLPQNPNCLEGNSDQAAVFLSDTANQFRDLLWALYAPPTQLCLYSKHHPDTLSIDRLLNIAELSIKYCIVSYEEWATERIYQKARDPVTSFLRKASPELCARVLNVAVLAGHQSLVQITEQRLIARMLWTNMNSQAILDVAEHHNLRRIRGVAYYKELIDLLLKSQASANGDSDDVKPPKTTAATVFSSVPDARRRRAMHHAYQSLVLVCQDLPNDVPNIEDKACPSHNECIEAWTRAWRDANGDVTLRQHGDSSYCEADVLGRLKAIMIHLRKTLPGLV